MLRNRSKAVTSKQALMADQIPLLSPTKNTPISSLISPRFLNGLLTKGHQFQDSETTLISPKSILDTKNSSTSVNPFGYDTNTSKPQTITSCNRTEPQAIGLALIDSLNQENTIAISPKPINRMALFGSNLKVQIPAAAAVPPPVETPKSPADFGIKTRNSHLLGTPAREFSRQLSLKEMELSEDYTCVITHGPNPKTTHIFDGCIVESCIGGDGVVFDDKKMECGFESISVSPCHSCKDSDEKIVCSHECQSEERDFGGSKSPE
ncbi:hypothetical protein C2S52_021150 [Perilla frutescens var. hirtella]|uniref:Uncharacterized protein n=1 Tax=Perilla frutescens var. hirtella TaxID=608512 RepID=A0AAD4IPI3_PERFH|nr:hypothetical protein C2S53_002266 [Perilla frutescens var. hirtella]KAH6796596.1 hypothetical protein C2S52_021150 [Perilla frutescens var. hirtella]KAH6808373.1 hypothetical protein C2S51_029481 [Perilla frutescens var. frutescens]